MHLIDLLIFGIYFLATFSINAIKMRKTITLVDEKWAVGTLAYLSSRQMSAEGFPLDSAAWAFSWGFQVHGCFSQGL